MSKKQNDERMTAQQEAFKNKSVCNHPRGTTRQAFDPSAGTLGGEETSGDEAVASTVSPASPVAAASNDNTRFHDPAVAAYGRFEDRASSDSPGFEPEVVVGEDDRTRRTDTDQYPWRCVCSLLMTDGRTGKRYVGTGWLVSPRVVLTAGHCVYLYDNDSFPNDTGAWATSIEVTPGRNGNERPFGSVESNVLRSSQGWVHDRDTRVDFGAIILPETHRFGDQLGWFGYAAWDDEVLSSNVLNLSGYPADKDAGTQWFHKQTASAVEEYELLYGIDTFGGQSGSPVWIKTAEGLRYGVGIHKTGPRVAGSGRNTAKRITQASYDVITGWVAEAP